MPSASVPGFKGDLSGRVALILQQLFVGFSDEAGNTTEANGAVYTVPVTNDYPLGTAAYPAVSVLVLFGSEPAGFANQQIDELDDGTPVFGFLAADSTIRCHIVARSDAERTFIANTLEMGIARATYVDPQTGLFYDGVIKLWLQDLNVFYKGIQRVEYPDPRTTDPRPEGLAFEADLSILCDIFVTWQGGVNQPVDIQFSYGPVAPIGVSTSIDVSV